MEWKITEKTEDGNVHTLFIRGEEVASVSKGWVRNGGECWVWHAQCIGFKTLKDAKRQIELKLGFLEL